MIKKMLNLIRIIIRSLLFWLLLLPGICLALTVYLLVISFLWIIKEDYDFNYYINSMINDIRWLFKWSLMKG